MDEHNAQDNWLLTRLTHTRAGFKLSLLLVSSLVLILMQNPWFVSGFAIMAAALWLGLGAQRHSSVKSGAWLWFALMLVMLGAYHAWITGWGAAIVTVARLLALVLLALVVMRTTPLSAMMALVEWLLSPLGRLGWVNPQRVALLVGLTLRFLPVLAGQWEEIREAQSARGLHANPVALLVPMLVRTLQRAEEITQALDARSPGDPPHE